MQSAQPDSRLFSFICKQPRCVGGAAGRAPQGEPCGVAYGGALTVLVCDFSECPFDLMSYCDASAAMRCPDCPFAYSVPDIVFDDDAEVLEYSGFGVSPF